MTSSENVRRVGSVISLREEVVELYEQYHRDVWPDVLAAISAAGIRNYSIYRFGTLLFSYWEYVGDDYEGDLAAIDRVPAAVKWNDLMAGLQVPVDGAGPREWLPLAEVFHMD